MADPTILDFKSMSVSSNGKTNQGYFRSSSYSGDFPNSADKSPPYGGSNYSTHSRTSARFPIGTFTLDASNVFNSGDNLGSPPNTSVFSNGNSSYNDSRNEQALRDVGTRETGIIEKLLHSYGFIQCCERQARLFFHFSQFSGNIEHLKIGDPVEFEMTYDRRTGKPIASTVSKIAPEVVLSEERVTGNVTTELKTDGSGGDTQGRISYENRGECFFLPYTKDDVEGNVTLRAGDKVSFQIATNQRGNLGACHIRLENPAHPVKYQGVVCSMKESFGFIERGDVVKEIFFHFSEAKAMKDELRLGDDVEFTIQTRNGKEVACGITRLKPGTVVFEDVGDEIVRGQVLKPVERNGEKGNARTSNQAQDPLPGRIRYRAPDHSEVEVPFGDKDQRGDFTLRHGDWVQFKVATDRRDQLHRATDITLLDDSFAVSGERRERGVVASLKDGFGFLRCAEREQRLFFHFSELLDANERETRIDDEFEFTVIHDTSTGNQYTSAGRQSAIRMKRLPQGTVQFETLVETGVTGIVTRESCAWISRSPTKGNTGPEQPDAGLVTCRTSSTDDQERTIAYYVKDQRTTPRLGDTVQFNVHQVKRNKELIAVDMQILCAARANGQTTSTATLKGFVAALKDAFGFIETVEHDREVFFHFSNLEGEANSLELGQEVEYTLGTRGIGAGSCSSAENVRVLPRGTITLPVAIGEVLEGTVSRPLRSVNPDQAEYPGLVRLEDGTELQFGITSLANKRELLQTGDPVQLQVSVHFADVPL